MAEERITLGAVRSVNPIRREVRLRLDADVDHLVEKLEWLHFSLRNGREVRGKILTATAHHSGPIVRLAPGMTRDTVAQLKDARVWIPASAWVPPAQEDFRPSHLEGLKVEDAEGRVLGIVVDVMETPANAAITIERPDGGRMLLPVIPQVILDVDFDAEVLRVGDIEPYAVEE